MITSLQLFRNWTTTLTTTTTQKNKEHKFVCLFRLTNPNFSTSINSFNHKLFLKYDLVWWQANRVRFVTMNMTNGTLSISLFLLLLLLRIVTNQFATYHNHYHHRHFRHIIQHQILLLLLLLLSNINMWQALTNTLTTQRTWFIIIKMFMFIIAVKINNFLSLPTIILLIYHWMLQQY